MLTRVLEPEVMDEADDAREYDAMDHGAVNRAFVDDLLRLRPKLTRVLDVGTGTALIPATLCCRVETCRVTATDMSRAMLEVARKNVNLHGLIDRVQLQQCDARQLPYEDGMFDVVMSNSIVHHIPDPAPVLAESVRVAAAYGLIFYRDLMRPTDSDTLDALVSTYAGQANGRQQQLFRQSLHAALNLDEIRDIVAHLKFDPVSVQATSDRHWTWVAGRDAQDPTIDI